MISAVLGGVTEPILYGIGLRYRRPFAGMIAGGLAGGAYAGLMHVAVYSLSPSNILSFTGFVGGSSINLVHGIIALVISHSGIRSGDLSGGRGTHRKQKVTGGVP